MSKNQLETIRSVSLLSTKTYSHYAWFYDFGLALIGQRRGLGRLLSRVPLPLPIEARVLEIGCGTGLVTQMLLERYPNIHLTAMDVNSEMLAQLRSKATHWPARWQDRLQIIQADILTFEPALPLDAVVASGVFEHLSLVSTLSLVVEWLKPGGILINLAVRRNLFTRLVLTPLFKIKIYSVTENRQALEQVGLRAIKIVPLIWQEFPANLFKILISASKTGQKSETYFE